MKNCCIHLKTKCKKNKCKTTEMKQLIKQYLHAYFNEFYRSLNFKENACSSFNAHKLSTKTKKFGMDEKFRYIFN